MKRLTTVLLTVAVFSLMAVPVFATGQGEKKANKQLTVGYVIPYEIGWFSSFVQGFELVAKDEGVKTVRLHHNYKADQETKAIQDLITMGVDGINDTAATAESAEYSSQLANEAKIPIQVTESGVAKGKGQPFAVIDFDWSKIYRTVADDLRKDESGELSVINIQGFAGTPPVIEGMNGLKTEIAKLDNMKLATDIQFGDYATEKSLGIIKALVEGGIKFNTAIGSSQEITEGIIQGLKEENVDLNKVIIVSVNGGPMDVENLKKGEIDYVLSQSPGLHGMIVAYNLISKLKGRTFQTKTYSPIIWVNKKNWQKKLIPWKMDNSWLPVVHEFVKTGKYKPELRTK